MGVRWVAFDNEVMCMGSHPEWADAVTRKNNLFYDAAKAWFPGASVQWYGRGDTQYWGWCDCWAPNTCFTMQERGDSTVGPEAYMIYNASLTNETIVRAAATAATHGEAHVTPYFAFGAGWLPSAAGARTWTWNMTYDPALSWATGAHFAPATDVAPLLPPPWDAVEVVGVYPHVLDARMAEIVDDTVGRTTTGRLHFAAYAMGAAQLKVFPRTPVMNVTAAPVLPCHHQRRRSTND